MLDWKVDGAVLRLTARDTAYGTVVVGISLLRRSEHLAATEIDDADARSLTAALIAAGYGPASNDRPCIPCLAEFRVTPVAPGERVFCERHRPPVKPSLHHWLGADAE